MKFSRFVKSCSVATLATLLLTPAAFADSGFMIGASIGETSLDDEFGLSDSDLAGKLMFGYIFDLPVVDFGIEAAYVDFGGASENLGGGASISVDADGFSGFGTVGVDFGLFGMFAKAGIVSWDLKARATGQGSISDSGSDPAYGVGFRLGFSSVEVRAEYELFDIEDADDTIDMISLGVVWRF